MFQEFSVIEKSWIKLGEGGEESSITFFRRKSVVSQYGKSSWIEPFCVRKGF